MALKTENIKSAIFWIDHRVIRLADIITGKGVVILFLLGILMLKVTSAANGQTAHRWSNPDYMWTPLYDNFEGNELNRKRWRVQKDMLRKDKVKTDLFIWADSASTVNLSNSQLHLSMQSSPNYVATDWHGDTITANFIAGEIETIEKFGYGIYECNADFAFDRGSFPAFWLMSSEPCGSNSNNEIDIAELKYEHDEPTLDNNLFYYPQVCGSPHYSPGMHEEEIEWNQPHTFKCIWTSEKLEYYVDDINTHEFENYGQEWYPQHPMRVILSQQITMYNYDPPHYGIVTPQTSTFNWVKVREFFLAPEIFAEDVIAGKGNAELDVDNRATNISWSISPAQLVEGKDSGRGSVARFTTVPGSIGRGTITFRFSMPSGETYSAEKHFFTDYPVYIDPDGKLIDGRSVEDNLTNPGSHLKSDSKTIQEWSFTLSPNPARNWFTVDVEQVPVSNDFFRSEQMNLTIYDQYQLVKLQQSISGKRKTKVNVSGWERGIYFVRISTLQKQVVKKLLIL